VYHAWKANGEDGQWAYDNFLNQRSLKSADSVRGQLARICQRMGVALVSTPFEDKSYYVNIRKVRGSVGWGLVEGWVWTTVRSTAWPPLARQAGRPTGKAPS
jgi:hypothetical protein